MEDWDEGASAKLCRAVLASMGQLRPLSFDGPVNHDPQERADCHPNKPEEQDEHGLVIALQVPHEDASTLLVRPNQ